MKKLLALILIPILVLIAGGFAIRWALKPPPAGPEVMERAFQEYRTGQWRTADKSVSAFIKDNPNAGDAYRARARVRLDIGNLSGADADINAAQQNGIKPEFLLALRAEKLVNEGNPLGAIQIIENTPYNRGIESEVERVRARALSAMGDGKAASLAYDRAVIVDPKNAVAWANMGYFRLDTGRPMGALEAADKALSINGNDLNALALRAATLRLVKGPKAAIAVYDEILKREPKHVGALLNSAAALGDIGLGSEMLRRTRKVLAIQPKNELAFYYLAVLATRAGDIDLARRLLARAPQLRENMPGAMLLDAVLSAREGSNAKALAGLERIAEQQPGNLKIRQMIGAVRQASGDNDGAVDALGMLAERRDADSYTLIALANAETGLGNNPLAFALLDQAANITPAPPDPFAVRNDDIYFQLARKSAKEDPQSTNRIDLILTMVARKEMGGALAEAKALSNDYAQSAPASVIVGDVLGAMGRYGEAATYYRKAIELDASEGVALRLIAALERSGQHGPAVDVLRQFLDQNPRNIDALVIAAGQLGGTNKWAPAAVLLEDVRERIGNRDVMILANLGWARLQLGEKPLAAALARAAYRLQPTNVDVTTIYGRTLFAGGASPDAAADVLEKAALMQPQDSAIAWDWAQAAAAAKRPTDAKLALNRVLSDPKFPARNEAMKLFKAQK